MAPKPSFGDKVLSYLSREAGGIVAEGQILSRPPGRTNKIPSEALDQISAFSYPLHSNGSRQCHPYLVSWEGS